MVEAAPLGDVLFSGADLPISGSPSAKQCGSTHNDDGVPRIASRNHVGNETSMGNIAIDDYEVEETGKPDGP